MYNFPKNNNKRKKLAILLFLLFSAATLPLLFRTPAKNSGREGREEDAAAKTVGSPKTETDAESGAESNSASGDLTGRSGTDAETDSETDVETKKKRKVAAYVKSASSKKDSKRDKIFPYLSLQIEEIGAEKEENASRKREVTLGKDRVVIKHPARLSLRFHKNNSTYSEKQIRVSIGTQTFTRPEFPFNFNSSEEETAIRWFLEGEGGSASEKSGVHSHLFIADGTPPQLKYKIVDSRISSKGAVSAAAKLRLIPDDKNGSGVKEIMWRLQNEEAWKKYQSSLTLADTFGAKESEKLYFFATDLAGNRSREVSISFSIDKTPPFLPELFVNFNNRGEIMVPKNGIVIPNIEEGATLEYRVNEENFKKIRTGQTLFLPENSTSSITIKISDEVGNFNQKIYKVKSDTRPPSTKIIINGKEVPL